MRTIAPSPLVRTPLVRLEGGLPGSLYAKDETRQLTGAYKVRGVWNRLSTSTLDACVVTASTGNHGAATATVSKILGRKCIVFVPQSTPMKKLGRIADAGAEIKLITGGYTECEEAARAFAIEIGAEFVESFDHIEAFLGHRAMYEEVNTDLGARPDNVFVPVGGGGGLAAALLAYAGTSTRVYGVELADAPAMWASIRARHRVTLEIPPGLPAEGLCVRTVGASTFAIAKAFKAKIIKVSVPQLAAAARFAYETAGIKPELAGAAGIAAAVAVRPPGIIAAIVTGGNIDDRTWSELVMGEAYRGL